MSAEEVLVDAAPTLAELTGAPLLPYPADHGMWAATHPGRKPDGELTDGRRKPAVGIEHQVIHNPGRTWGSCSLHVPFPDTVRAGDTLFHGGPGATGRSYSDRPTIEASLHKRLLTLPGNTVVRTGHGADTTVAAERPNVPAH